MKLPIYSRVAAATTAAVLIAALGACATINRPKTASSTGGENAAKAAAFRYLFTNNASALNGNAAAYCIGSGSAATPTNPSPELLSLLSDVRPAVQPISACRAGERVVDSAGRPALIFNLETTECDGVTSCVFRGGYQEGNLSASMSMYRARFVDGRWQVAQEGPMAIS